MSKEIEYPVELESQLILRMPEEVAKSLRDVLRSGENFKNRLTIQIDNDMRHGEVRFDHWLLHAKIFDLPTIVESLKTIDRKSVYKTADICQLMVCKDEIDPTSTEEESPNKNKKKDPFKVDKKFLWPHGVTPPTKNVRKRRFRKTLKKKCAEAPEIEKEVKRLLRADNEADSITWEIVQEEDQPAKPETVTKTKKGKMKAEAQAVQSSSKVEDIFGGTLSDSDLEDENLDVEDSRASYDDHSFESTFQDMSYNESSFATQFNAEMISNSKNMQSNKLMKKEKKERSSTSAPNQYTGESQFDQTSTTDTMLQQIASELEELKQRRQRTQTEIAGMENMTLRQRFQDILQTLNKDIEMKEIEYKRLLSHK